MTRKAESYGNGWCTIWDPEMDKCVGQVYEVQEDRGRYGFRLKDSCPDYKYGWCFPYFVLEKFPPKPKKPKGFWNLKAVNESV